MRIQTFSSFEGVDRDKLRELLEHRFKQKLIPDYFEYAHPNLVTVAMSSDLYAGATVMENFSGDLWYLDKIVTAEQFDKTLLFLRLWNGVEERGKVVWRARPENNANKFYMNRSIGLSCMNGWRVYWRGMNVDEKDLGVEYALSKKPSFLAS